MNAAENKCIWSDQCGDEECEMYCEHFYPTDGSLEEKEYENCLRDNVAYYQRNMNIGGII